MTYYVTETSPLVFTTDKEEKKVTEATIERMLLLLLRREFEMYESKEAVENLNYWLGEDSAFRSWGAPHTVPSEWTEKEIPTEQEMWEWMTEFLHSTEAGSNLLSQIGEPLTEADEDSQSYLNDETTLSDQLEGMANPSEMDSAGPMMHSNRED